MMKEENELETPGSLPSFRPILITSLVMALIGIIGLVVLFSFTTPTLGPRWLLFFLITLAASGLFLPVAHFLHLRFPSTPPADSSVLVREALEVGGYLDLLVWLQLGRVLNFALAIFIAAGIVAIELLLRLRERSRWKPQV